MTTIPADIQTLIDQEMALGNYESQEDLLRHALIGLRSNREMRDYDDETIEGVQRGLADAAAGRLTPRAEFEREFRLRNNIPFKS